MPLSGLKATAPIYLMVVIFIAINFGRIERVALTDTTDAVLLGGALITVHIGARLLDAFRRRTTAPFDFDGLPETPTQRLGIGESV